MIETEFTQEILDYDWLSHCGSPVNVGANILIDSEKVNDSLKSVEFDNFCTETQNVLTEYLFINARESYNKKWNYSAEIARPWINTTLKESISSRFIRERLPEFAWDTIAWFVMLAYHEYVYRDIKVIPKWGRRTLGVFKSGHMPCGWSTNNLSEGVYLVY